MSNGHITGKKELIPSCNCQSHSHLYFILASGSEFGQELLDIFQEKRQHIMAQQQVTEFEQDEEQIDAKHQQKRSAKYGGGITVEYKGQFVFDSGNGQRQGKKKERKLKNFSHPTFQTTTNKNTSKANKGIEVSTHSKFKFND